MTIKFVRTTIVGIDAPDSSVGIFSYTVHLELEVEMPSTTTDEEIRAWCKYNGLDEDYELYGDNGHIIIYTVGGDEWLPYNAEEDALWQQAEDEWYEQWRLEHEGVDEK